MVLESKGKKPLIVLDVSEIKRMYRRGASSREIATFFGVSQPTILARLKALGVSLKNPFRERISNVVSCGQLKIFSRGRWHTVFFDSADETLIRNHHWFINKGGYVWTYFGKPVNKDLRYLHRMMFSLDKGNPLQVDHFDGDKLNCCRANLIVVTRRQNSQNVVQSARSKSGHRNVVERQRGWFVQIQPQYKTLWFGPFSTKEAAIKKALEVRKGFFEHVNEQRSEYV